MSTPAADVAIAYGELYGCNALVCDSTLTTIRGGLRGRDHRCGERIEINEEIVFSTQQ